MKVISFSLWGTNPVYTIGAVKNALLAATLFPDWICVFYCFKSVPVAIINQLDSMPNVNVRRVTDDLDEQDNRGMFHRFLPAGEQGVECMLCRDTDSRLSERERFAVNAWLESGADLHVMRDHPYHSTPILGGMWGVRGAKLIGIDQGIKRFRPTRLKGQDQQFLYDWVWNKYKEGNLSALIHDPFFIGNPFPSDAKRGLENGGVWFIGQVFDEFDRFNSQHDLDVLLNAGK